MTRKKGNRKRRSHAKGQLPNFIENRKIEKNIERQVEK